MPTDPLQSQEKKYQKPFLFFEMEITVKNMMLSKTIYGKGEYLPFCFPFTVFYQITIQITTVYQAFPIMVSGWKKRIDDPSEPFLDFGWKLI